MQKSISYIRGQVTFQSGQQVSENVYKLIRERFYETEARTVALIWSQIYEQINEDSIIKE